MACWGREEGGWARACGAARECESRWRALRHLPVARRDFCRSAALAGTVARSFNAFCCSVGSCRHKKQKPENGRRR